MDDQTIKVDKIMVSKEAQEYCNDLVCKNCACCECECDKALCSKLYYATKAFDSGADLVINGLMKYLAEYPLPAIGVDKILAKLKEIKYGE